MSKEEEKKLLTSEEVLSRTGLSRSALYRRLDRKAFPAPLKVRSGDHRRVMWNASEVAAWIACGGAIECQCGAAAPRESSSRLEPRMGDLSQRLLLLANALRYAADGHARTDPWWRAYVSSAGKEIADIASAMPGGCAGLIEFQKDLP